MFLIQNLLEVQIPVMQQDPFIPHKNEKLAERKSFTDISFTNEHNAQYHLHTIF